MSLNISRIQLDRQSLITSINEFVLFHDDVLYDEALFIDLSYRVASWSLDNSENVGIFIHQDTGTILAIFCFQSPFWTVDYFIKKDLPDAVWEYYIVPWIVQQRKKIIQELGQKINFHFWYVEGKKLSNRFFDSLTISDWRKYHYKYVLKDRSITVPSLPNEYTIRPINVSEIEKYVLLHQKVFGTKNMTPAWRKQTFKMPFYRNDLDLIIEYKNERFVAFCIFWYHPVLKLGKIEPLGVDEEFRHMGLGKILVFEGLQRLQNLGAVEVLVTTDNDLVGAQNFYQAVGFQKLLMYESLYMSTNNF